MVGGLRFPFTAERAAKGNPSVPLGELRPTSTGNLVAAAFLGKNDNTVIAGNAERDSATSDGTPVTFAGFPGLLRDESNRDAGGQVQDGPAKL